MKAIILAGGSGSRLWPLSREMYPKQLINLENKNSLLQQTYRRLSDSEAIDGILTITNIKHYQNILLQLNKICPNNTVLAEPLSKNTAPAIACALQYWKKKFGDCIVLVLPSDQLITDLPGFYNTLKKAETIAEQGYIVTFGIKPHYPETGYGYVKVKEKFLSGFLVEKFVEKPDLETARHYVESGEYFWNGGIFMGKISVFFEEFRKYCPEIAEIAQSADFENNFLPYEKYEKMPSVSIDYAVMEKSDKIALVRLESDWNDLGSWQALYAVKEKDENNNVIFGSVITHNVKNSLIYSQKELVAVSDLENIVLVETEDAVMACSMDKSQNVKKLYEKLQEKQSETVKLHKTVLRPWGYYTCLNKGNNYLTKIICVMPHHKLSLQSHNFRSEHWVVLEGEATVLLENEKFTVHAGQSIDIPVKAKHSLQNERETELKIIEIQKGDYISEDDIIRYEDMYGRTEHAAPKSYDKGEKPC